MNPRSVPSARPPLALFLSVGGRMGLAGLLGSLAACASRPPAPPPTLTSATVAAPESVAGPADALVNPIGIPAEDLPPLYPRPLSLEPLRQWTRSYHDAASLLAEWALAHPETARRLAVWQRERPEQFEVLVDWALTNVGESPNAILLDRSGWDDYRRIVNADGDAMDAFVTWIRGARGAAIDLARHDRGIAFVASGAHGILRAHR